MIVRLGSTPYQQGLIHRDPRFFPEPERFDPERWNIDRRQICHAEGNSLCASIISTISYLLLFPSTTSYKYTLLKSPQDFLPPNGIHVGDSPEGVAVNLSRTMAIILYLL